MQGNGKPSKSFIPSDNGSGYGFVPIQNLPDGGQIRETIKVDKEGNIGDDHVTVQIPGGQKIHIRP
ncbi:MAG: hypothetical protein PHP03_01870 [Candidatus Pacebacteria bacterium]|nr:hypothetical protein [Candidatus Paceibacterota bacterium]